MTKFNASSFSVSEHHLGVSQEEAARRWKQTFCEHEQGPTGACVKCGAAIDEWPRGEEPTLHAVPIPRADEPTRKVFLCSPLKGNIEHNTLVVKLWGRRLALHGAAVFAPHLFYPLLLNELDDAERAAGIRAGKAFLAVCDEVAVDDRAGISDGMAQELELARQLGKPIVQLRGDDIPLPVVFRKER